MLAMHTSSNFKDFGYLMRKCRSLEKIWAQRREQKNIPLQDIQPLQFGAASNFFNNLFY
jgi:hypothetical protein